MRRAGDLFERMTSLQNLERAFRAARRGKRGKLAVRAYTYQLEQRLLRTRERLVAGSYRFGPYREFRVCDTKPRKIVAAPFGDRVVHHAICQVIEPIFDRSFIHDSYACRVGKGNLGAVLRLRRFLRAAPRGYVLSCDVRRYFQSVDHDNLLELLARKLKDRRLLELLRDLIETAPVDPEVGPGKGIPIGNLTSQLFANVYLDPLDHFAKERLKLRRYVRYVDDFQAVHPDKKYLHGVRETIRGFLAERLQLKLHPRKATVTPVRCGTDFLGYRVWPHRMRVRRANLRRFIRRERKLRAAYWTGEISAERYWESVTSWLAFAGHADSTGLVRRLGLDTKERS